MAEVKKTSNPGKPSTKMPAAKLAPMNSLSPAAEDIKWRAKDAMHTIARAEEHKKDRELMKHVKQMAKQTMKAVCK